MDPATLKACSRCKQAHYCDKQCQTAHWKDHKEECKVCVEQDAKLSTILGTLEPRWILPRKDDDEEDDLLEQWARTMPARDYRGATPQIRMEQLGMTAAFVRGIEIGDWGAVKKRMVQMSAPVNITNTPPLKQGDHVQVEPGNSVRRELVGERGILIEYFKREKKWGIDMDNGTPTRIKAGNLKRVR